MGWLGLAALIPAFRGETGTALAILAADFLLDSQERKDRQEHNQIAQHNYKNSLHEDEYQIMFTWAFGRQFWSEEAKGLEHDVDLFIARGVEWFNARFGHACYIMQSLTPSAQLKQIANLWVRWGKPLGTS